MSDRASTTSSRLPQELNSFQRMSERNGIFEERLNDQLTNDVLCLGMKGAQQFAFTTKASGQSRITATLSPSDDNGLRAMLRTKGNVRKACRRAATDRRPRTATEANHHRSARVAAGSVSVRDIGCASGPRGCAF
ncbi:MAG: hypothetical protein IPJ85_01115 [Flavobacteriales bacterium]|nr:hypothetical protein [Flavobacteriales bacterium]